MTSFQDTYAGIRVLDLSENIAGPLACMIFADLGADVIKVERPGTGDATRSLPPRWGGESTVFQTVNRNKRSAALDIGSGAGRSAVLALVAKADVLVDSFRPGVGERMGLGFDAIKLENPSIIHCSVSAFGTGPLGHSRPGYDALIQAFTGIMDLTGEPDGRPVRAAPSIIDISTGLWAALAIQAALARRHAQTGAQRLEAALVDSGLFLMCHQVIGFLGTGELPERLGSAAPSAAPYQVFSTRDRPIMIATSTDRMYRELCVTLGLDELADDPRFRTMEDRIRSREELAEVLQQRIQTQTSQYWLDLLMSQGIPVTRVHTLAEALQDAVTQERGLIAPADEGPVPNLLQMHLPIDSQRAAPRRQAPALGQHTEEVLLEVGCTLAEAAAAGAARP